MCSAVVNRREGESIDNSVTRLREKKKAATCDYGGLKDEMICDKILGITNERTRCRLLSEKKLTLLSAHSH